MKENQLCVYCSTYPLHHQLLAPKCKRASECSCRSPLDAVTSPNAFEESPLVWPFQLLPGAHMAVDWLGTGSSDYAAEPLQRLFFLGMYGDEALCEYEARRTSSVFPSPPGNWARCWQLGGSLSWLVSRDLGGSGGEHAWSVGKGVPWSDRLHSCMAWPPRRDICDPYESCQQSQEQGALIFQALSP